MGGLNQNSQTSCPSNPESSSIATMLSGDPVMTLSICPGGGWAVHYTIWQRPPQPRPVGGLELNEGPLWPEVCSQGSKKGEVGNDFLSRRGTTGWIAPSSDMFRTMVPSRRWTAGTWPYKLWVYRDCCLRRSVGGDCPLTNHLLGQGHGPLSETGRLKMRDMVIQDGQKCRTWKCETWIWGACLHGWKLRDMKMQDQLAEVENAGHENAGPICRNGKCGKS